MMDGKRFDGMIQAFAGSRRSLLTGMSALGAGLLAGSSAGARKHRKGKRRNGRKAQPNEFGCLEFGNPCASADDCCSGMCEGKKGKRRCAAHDTGNCAAGLSSIGCGGSAEVACMTDLGGVGLCVTTTGNAGFCGASFRDFACQTDLDCQTMNGGQLGPRAACIRCTDATGGALCAEVAGSPS